MIDSNWEKIILLYQEGVTIREIANIIGVNEKTLSKRINKNLKHLKELHKKKLDLLRKFSKEDKKDGRKFIVDSSFVKWNRSIYQVDKGTGDLRAAANCIIPIDVPEIIENRQGKEYRATFKY